MVEKNIKSRIGEEIELSKVVFRRLYYSKYPVPFDPTVKEWKCLITQGESPSRAQWYKGQYKKGSLTFHKIKNIETVPIDTQKAMKGFFKDSNSDEREYYMLLANFFFNREILNTESLAEYLYNVVNETACFQFTKLKNDT